jgi:hypothetical protein
MDILSQVAAEESITPSPIILHSSISSLYPYTPSTPFPPLPLSPIPELPTCAHPRSPSPPSSPDSDSVSSCSSHSSSSSSSSYSSSSSSSSSSWSRGANNYYWVYEGSVRILLWEQGDYTSRVSEDVDPPWNQHPTQVCLVDQSTWEELRLMDRRWYRCYDHLSQLWFAAWLERVFEDNPAIADACRIFTQFYHPYFNSSTPNAYYRPLHTVFYMNNSFDNLSLYAYRVVVQHVDGNTMNNLAPCLRHQLLENRKLVDQHCNPLKQFRNVGEPIVFACSQSNIRLWFIPAFKKQTYYSLLSIHLPRVRLQSGKGKNAVIAGIIHHDEKAPSKWRSKDHDPTGRHILELLSFVATLLPPYASRESDDFIQREHSHRKCEPNTIFRMPSAHRIFTEPITHLGSHQLLTRQQTDLFISRLFAENPTVKVGIPPIGGAHKHIGEPKKGKKRNRMVYTDSDSVTSCTSSEEDEQ